MLPLKAGSLPISQSGSSATIQNVASKPTGEDDQPLFLEEIGYSTHGKKHWYDYLIEADPGSCKVKIAEDYEQNVPQKIAVLPFTVKGNAQFSINGLNVKSPDKDECESWRWTLAQRARRAFHGFLSSREFETVALSTIDRILLEKNIGTESSLKALKPEILGKWLGADSLVYGEVYPYQMFYLVMGSGIRVNLSVTILSAKTGKVLFNGTVNRNYLRINPRFDPIDIAISSVLTLSTLRDINLRRAEDEACRELALRIPPSPRKAYPVQSEKEEISPKALPLPANHVANTGYSTDGIGVGMVDLPANHAANTGLHLSQQLGNRNPLPANPAADTGDDRLEDFPPENDFTSPPRAWPANEKKPEPQRFFLPEKPFVDHGKKKTLDYILDIDPSHFKCTASAFLAIERPQKFAILPFVDDATQGHFIINGIPLSLRSKERRAQLRWTIANRLRRGIACYLAQRDWDIQSLDITDNILKAHGWKKASDIQKTDPATLGDWLGVDCVVYGRVSSLMSIYALMYSACRVGISVKLVSTKSSKNLVEISGSRTESSFAPAFDPLDIAVSSITTALLIRDVTFRRAEDEVCREIAARIPSSYKETTETD